MKHKTVSENNKLQNISKMIYQTLKRESLFAPGNQVQLFIESISNHYQFSPVPVSSRPGSSLNYTAEKAIIWPAYWNTQWFNRLKMHSEKINNLLVIYEISKKEA